MRTPNTSCLICAKPLYRRPSDMVKARYAACMACRSEAQKVAGITADQLDGLSMGRVKGDNRRTGYVHRDDSKRKASQSHKDWCAANPERVAERGAKVRGENHYLWNGGSSRLNTSIRQMTENRRWMDAVKARDGKCVRCGSGEKLESHHKKSLAELVAELGIASREDARRHAAVLWDLNNGETLCEPCHYAEHGRALPCG
jgi:5-methylcytosine-specific restriction endonuclease McrA